MCYRMKISKASYGFFGRMILISLLFQCIHMPWLGLLLVVTYLSWPYFVYASCGYLDRIKLWTQLQRVYVLNPNWIKSGDFNTIRINTGKIGGRAKPQVVMDDFNTFIHNCHILEPNLEGSKCTRCNGHEGQAQIWAKLDRTLVSYNLIAIVHQIYTFVLARTCLDYSPLLVQAKDVESRYGPPILRFMWMWCTHKYFDQLIHEN